MLALDNSNDDSAAIVQASASSALGDSSLVGLASRNRGREGEVR
jgi:hypothetical protein